MNKIYGVLTIRYLIYLLLHLLLHQMFIECLLYIMPFLTTEQSKTKTKLLSTILDCGMRIVKQIIICVFQSLYYNWRKQNYQILRNL